MRAKRNIYLIGFSGSGKTSVGNRLARRLKKQFIDTDSMIVEKTGKEISRIFADRGEASFRRLEMQTINSLTRRPDGNMVVALGGGAFESKANRDRLLGTGTVVYLSCSLKELCGRLKMMGDRPLLASTGRPETHSAQKLKVRIRTLRNKRARNYMKAHIVVSTSSRTVGQTVGMEMPWFKPDGPPSAVDRVARIVT